MNEVRGDDEPSGAGVEAAGTEAELAEGGRAGDATEAVEPDVTVVRPDPTLAQPQIARDLQDLQPGDPAEVDGYALTGRLPGHHQGNVFLAQNRNRSGWCVLKLSGGTGPGDLERIQREASYLAKVRSPRVAKVLDSGVWSGRDYLVQEFIDGPTLADLFKERNGQPSPLADGYRLARGLAEALQDVHRADVRHRDVKPSNIIVNDSRGVVLVDFGIALAQADPRITQHGITLGTPRYMSPEQITGVPVEEASDVFQWGLVVGEALLGRHPLRGVDADALRAVQRCDVDPALAGTSLGRLADDALQMDPSRRPTLAQILGELDRTEVLPGPNETLAIPLPERRLRDVRSARDLKAMTKPWIDDGLDLLADRFGIFIAVMMIAAILGWLLGFLLGAAAGTPWGGS